LEDKNSRRATMIYNRPSMQTEYNKNGMNDFICTYYSAFFIRNNKLINIVTMRSNDAIYGFFNDFYWHCEVYKRLYADLLNKYTGLEYDNMYWRADSFHVYERHFKLLEKIIKETEDENNKNQTG